MKGDGQDADSSGVDVDVPSDTNLLKKFHELEVHQIELKLLLEVTGEELDFEIREKAKRAAELIIANEELAFQNEEKAKRAAVLIIANKELTFQHDEKAKRAAELAIANKELSFQNEEKSKRAAELETEIAKALRLNHELDVYQTELKALNEELVQAKERTEVAAQKYAELYDFAPTGYFTLSYDGTILGANISGAEMLGKERTYLASSRFDLFVSSDTKQVFSLFLKKAFRSKAKESCEITLTSSGNQPVFVNLTGIVTEKEDQCLLNMVDITTSKQATLFKDIHHEVLEILNEPGALHDIVQRLIDRLKIRCGFDAVGIRLQDGDDFPYFAQNGFSADFLLTENTLVCRSKDGGLCRGKNGDISLECFCGLVISSNPNPVNQPLTARGSFWTNHSYPFLSIPPEEDPRLHPRNVCIHHGYTSMALIPIKDTNRNIGLIQFNSRSKDFFTPDLIENLEGIATHIGDVLMRKKAEDELQKANVLLSSFLNHSPIFAFIKEVTPTESRVLKASENFREMIGIPGSEMEGKDMYELFPAEFAASMTADDWKVVSEGKILELEEVMNDRIFHTIKYPIMAGSKNLMAGYSIDITEQRVLEKQLQESERQYRILAETSPEGILIIQGVNFRYVNQQMAEITGYSVKELMMTPFMDFVYPEDRELVQNNYQKRQKGEAVDSRYQFRIVKKDGCLAWIELNGSKSEWEGETAVLQFVTDITDRKQIELVRQELEARHSSMIANISEAISVIGADGLMKYKSPNSAKWFGWQPEDLIGTNGWLTVHPDDLQRIQKEFYSLIEDASLVKTLIYRYKCKDGSYKPIELTATNHLKDPSINGILLNYRDITNRIEAEEEIRLKNAELQKLNAEKDMLFSIIAHDLRSPFQTLLGFTPEKPELLLTYPLEKIQRLAINMRTSANKLYSLLENLLEWSQMQRGLIRFDPVPILLPEAIAEIADLIRDTAEKKMIEISCAIPDNLTATADKRMFESVVRNLVFNAVKFTQKEGKVMITTRIAPGNMVEISIKDTGIGMGKDILDKLFQLDANISQKGTEGEPSTGLGLFICKDFVEKHGGRLWAESEEGKGGV
ncbi:MAG: PAS domain S-box protein [Mariniphaga sp.]